MPAEPEPFTVTRYRCPHRPCRRTFGNKTRAVKHAAVCWFDHGCKTCAHAEYIGVVWVDGCELGENLRTSDEDPNRVVPRSHCPLWEAPEATP